MSFIASRYGGDIPSLPGHSHLQSFIASMQYPNVEGDVDPGRSSHVRWTSGRQRVDT